MFFTVISVLVMERVASEVEKSVAIVTVMDESTDPCHCLYFHFSAVP
jgi:hypothetical protein